MNHSKHTVQTQQNTIASTLFQAEAWKNAFIKLLPQHVIKKSGDGHRLAWDADYTG